MGTIDKVDDKIDQATGKAKQAYGKATGDQKVHDEGVIDEAKGKAGEIVEDVKDKVGDLKDKVTY